MALSKDTQVCISIASHPSNMGTILYNAAFAELGIDFIYKAFCVSDLASTITGVRALRIRGCSVSMPFKKEVLKYLDFVDPSAREAGAVNTIVNSKGVLQGYNTDVVAASTALKTLNVDPRETVFLLGAGGVARAILVALKQLGFNNITVSARDTARLDLLSTIVPFCPVDWAKKHLTHADIIINATPIGMSGHEQGSPFSESTIGAAKKIVDVVSQPSVTELQSIAEQENKLFISGSTLGLLQMMEQFRYYTGHEAPLVFLQKIMEKTKLSPR